VLEKTPLAGGDTRPAFVKYIGMPLRMVVGLVVAYGLILAIMPGWYYRLIALGILAMVAIALSELVRRDHNAPRIVLRWLQSKAKSLDNYRWNGATVEPWPARRSKTPRGIV
jgi:type IV secretory pathway VirB3-like protein